MIGIFRQKNPANILVLLFFGVLIKLPMFIYPHPAPIQPKDGVLFQSILKLLEPAGKTKFYRLPGLGFSTTFYASNVAHKVHKQFQDDEQA